MNAPQPSNSDQWPWLPGTGTAEHPMTHGGGARVGHHCRCFRCGLTALCGPLRDFYTTDDPAGPLYCEGCMWGLAAESILLTDAGLVPKRSVPSNN
jgi:hypothetical protein